MTSRLSAWFWRSRASHADACGELRQEGLERLMRLGGLAWLVPVTAAGLAARLFAFVPSSASSAFWGLSLAAVLLLRALLYVRWHALARHTLAQPPAPWERRIAGTACIEGLIWGALPWTLHSDQSWITYAMLALLAGVALAGMLAFGASRSVLACYLIPIFVGQGMGLAVAPLPLAKPMLLCWLLLGALALAVTLLSVAQDGRAWAEPMRQSDFAAQQRTLLDTLTVGVLVIHQGRITDCNQGLLQMLGYAREELLGAPEALLALSPVYETLGNPPPQGPLVSGSSTAGLQQCRNKQGGALFVQVHARRVDARDPASPIVTVLEDVTGRLSAERELAESRERFRLALEALQSGVWDVDLIEQRFFFSRRFRSLLDLPEDDARDALPKRLFFHHDAILAEDADRVADARRATLLNGASFDVQYRIRVGERVVWLRETALVLLGEQGQPARFTGAITDTTAINQIQQRLQTSESFHRSLIDASTTFIWCCDQRGVLTFANERGARELYGYEPHEIVGRRIYDLLPPESLLPEAQAQFDPVLQGETVHNIEMVQLTKSNKRIFVSINAVPLRNAQGQFDGMMGINTDITHVKRRERAFQDVTRLQRLIFDAAGEGIVLVRKQRIYRVNQAFADLIGMTQGELVARGLEQYFEDPSAWLLLDQQLIDEPLVVKSEQRMLRSNGQPLWVAMTGRRTEMDDLGDLHIWVFADISARKEQEQQSWYSANHDELTGLPNRRLLQDRFEQSLAHARRESGRIALMMLDLDGFKIINDRFGHQQGDLVLRQIAGRLEKSVRQIDTVARLGGDEFVVVLHQFSGLSDLELMARRLIDAVLLPIDVQGQSVSVTTSIGIAVYPEAADGVVGLMHAADLAMYAAKRAGKNTFTLAIEPVRAGARLPLTTTPEPPRV